MPLQRQLRDASTFDLPGLAPPPTRQAIDVPYPRTGPESSSLIPNPNAGRLNARWELAVYPFAAPDSPDPVAAQLAKDPTFHFLASRVHDFASRKGLKPPQCLQPESEDEFMLLTNVIDRVCYAELYPGGFPVFYPVQMIGITHLIVELGPLLEDSPIWDHLLSPTRADNRLTRNEAREALIQPGESNDGGGANVMTRTARALRSHKTDLVPWYEDERPAYVRYPLWYLPCVDDRRGRSKHKGRRKRRPQPRQLSFRKRTIRPTSGISLIAEAVSNGDWSDVDDGSATIYGSDQSVVDSEEDKSASTPRNRSPIGHFAPLRDPPSPLYIRRRRNLTNSAPAPYLAPLSLTRPTRRETSKPSHRHGTSWLAPPTPTSANATNKVPTPPPPTPLPDVRIVDPSPGPAAPPRTSARTGPPAKITWLLPKRSEYGSVRTRCLRVRTAKQIREGIRVGWDAVRVSSPPPPPPRPSGKRGKLKKALRKCFCLRLKVKAS